MNKTLRERIAAVRELDKARTPGEIIAKEFAKAPASGKAKAIDHWKLSTQITVLGSMEKSDALFLAQAPEMAFLINDLERKLEVAEKVINYVLWQYEGHAPAESNHWSGKLRETLTLISLDKEE